MGNQGDMPSYEQVLEDAEMKATAVPSESATATEIRVFIAGVLARQYDIDRPHAQQIANLWTLGSGRELRKFPARLFVSIFGEQAGWIIYKEVSAGVIRENMDTMAVFDSKKRESTLCTLIVLDAIFAISWFAFKGARFLTGPIFVMLALCILIFAAIGTRQPDPREKPEAELRYLLRSGG